MHPYYGYGYPRTEQSVSGFRPYWLKPYRAPTTADPSDVKQFKYSANQFMEPTLEMYHLLTQLSHSDDLAKNIKEAASKSEHSKVVSLIQTAGVKSPFGLTYSPEGLIMTFNPADPSACFSIRMSLCW